MRFKTVIFSIILFLLLITSSLIVPVNNYNDKILIEQTRADSDITLSNNSYDVSVETEQIKDEYLTISNDGNADLDYYIGDRMVLNFDGDGDYVKIPSSDDDFKFNGDFTLEAWVYIEDGTGDRNIVNRYGLGGPWTGHYLASYKLRITDSKPVFGIRDNADTTGDNIEGNALDLNKWYHIVGIREGNQIKLYVDGELVTEKTTTETGSLTEFKNNPIAIGAGQEYNTNDYTVFFDGMIDDVRIWNDVRTQIEIQDNMNIELNGDEANLVGYWKFNEGSGSTAEDSTSNNNDGTLYGDTHYVVVSSLPNWLDLSQYSGTISSSSSYALNFDGDGDYIHVSDSTYYEFTGDFSLEVWVYIKGDTSTEKDFIMRRYGRTNMETYGIAQALFDLYIENSKPIFRIRDDIDDDSDKIEGHELDLNRWYHLAGVRNESLIELYIDGELVNETTTTETGTLTQFNNYPLTIGAGQVWGSYGERTKFFDGCIDDVRIWNNARTQTEIQDNMNIELNGDEGGLVGYWNFNEGSGTTAEDSTINNNDGTLYGDTHYVNGKIAPNESDKITLTFDSTGLSPGDYQTNLYVHSNDPDEGLITIPVNLTVISVNELPMAYAGLDQNVYVGGLVILNGNGSHDSDGIIVNWTWNIGDGAVLYGEIINYSYLTVGNYTVTLIVEDDDGAIDQDTCIVTVEEIPNEPPVAIIGMPVNGFTGKYYNLPADHPEVEGEITGVVTGDSPFNHDWYDSEYFSFERTDENLMFGPSWFPVDDGLPGDPSYFAVHWNANITVDVDGNYSFEMGSDDDSWLFIDNNMIIDLGGIHAYAVSTNTVYLNAGYHNLDIYFAERHLVESGFYFAFLDPNIGITTLIKDCENLELNVDETFTLDASESYDPDGTIVNCVWDFGDGNTVSSTSVNHSYMYSGVYNITLTVTDDKGETDMDVCLVTVNTLLPAHNIDKDTYHLTIQDAIDNADVEDKIEISAGTYNENIVIDKSLNLVGDSNVNTIIDGGIYISANFVSISGFRVTDTSYGISIGICIEKSSNIIIEDVLIIDVHKAIKISDSPYTIIENCNISNCREGIEIKESSDAKINNCVISNIEYGDGIDIIDSSNCEITSNELSIISDIGIYIQEGENNIISACVIFNVEYGVLLETPNNDVTDCIITASECDICFDF